MNEDAYRAHSAINWSLLKRMGESPAHYRHARDNEQEDSDTLTIGSALHALVLEPMRFAEMFAIWPESSGSRRGKAWEAFKASAEASGVRILREQEITPIQAMAEALRANEDFAGILATNDHCLTEHAIVWFDDEFNRACKARVDYMGWGARPILLDIKTAQTTNPPQFGSQAAKLGYVGQLAHYRKAVASQLAIQPEDVTCYLAVVEKSPPYVTAVFEVVNADIQVGETDRARYLTQLDECERANVWPGRVQGVSPLRLPAWYYSDTAARPEDYDNETIDGEDLATAHGE